MAEGDTGTGSRGEEAVVLVVEDDRVCRSFCVGVLRRQGYEVRAAADAREGLRLLASSAPLAIVSDLQLPDPLEREALFSACDTRHGRPAPALILMTADAGPPGRRYPPTHGLNPVLFKPFTETELLQAVRRALGRGGADPGVRDQGLPGSDVLGGLFRARLVEELEHLGELIAALRWSAAVEVLHRLAGGSAMSGYGVFAEHCRGFSTLLSGAGPGDGWADRYLELLRLGEDIVDRKTALRRRG